MGLERRREGRKIDWKGGVKEGKSVSDIYNVFPIPETDINNNPNMSQNEGY